jgi:hypothetical protein
MRSLRLFRSANTDRNAPGAGAGVEGSGLLAFASEAPSDAPGATAERPQDARMNIALAVLAALVVLQSVPTALWMRGRFAAPVVESATVPAAPLAFSSPPPCEASPAPAPASGRESSPVSAAAAAPSAAPPAMVAGLISVAAPVPMQIYARGKLVGTTETETIMLPVGTHDLTLENTAVGYQARRSVTVQAGRTSTLRLDPPPGTLHVNAVPWAEVSIDNRRVGETPIGNYQLPIGSHQVVFRHPELGERRTDVLVTLKGPARLSMDMRTK